MAVPYQAEGKKGDSSPVMPFFLNISQGEKNSKILIFFVDMSYVRRI